MDLRDMLIEGCRQLDIKVNDTQVEQLLTYKDVLLEWNQKMNLTAIQDEKDVIIKHFLDSITCLKVKEFKNEGKLIDVGTGAGFPGIPLKVFNPNIQLTLLDSLNKRLNFLKEVCNQLDLDGVQFSHGRAEDYGQDAKYREQFDFVVARAVASLNVLSEYCLPFVKMNGYFICQKGPLVEDELKDAQKAIKVLGGEVEDLLSIQLPFSDINHRIVIIKKVKQTPTKYPRKAGTPGKNPII
ncbi:16S rRNA (guanine(527)-N(7))-methyltransferase RsmG [Alkaliphilus hydrothermalis]|uniref:Ribosomal RNA small subunit methyltransferase G n=1 Tax=Alkaliphilus hydrothermalis TaxID=1482730 RepID=A0ABS2NRJ2_9FIRM|nr:16S rRNA (guanine(527)-N(7))-methyltransferase RsmG [Alkaliphilus hydrothermalis]MBM7615584.1 16S rRNA (guanine527-N7)-methyltransferase [Alkaliphilus hydrothermalis]